METTPQKPAAPVAPPAGSPPPFAGDVMMKRQGGTAVKVWGVLLLIGALFSLMNVGGSVALALTGGFDFSTMPTTPGMDEQLRTEMNQFMKDVVAQTMASPTFWVNMVLGMLMTLLCFAASIQLLRSRPSGRTMAIALGLLGLLSLPLTGYEMLNQMNSFMPPYMKMMQGMIDRQESKYARYTPPGSKPEDTMTEEEKRELERVREEMRASRKRQGAEIMAQMTEWTKVASVVSVVLTIMFMLVVDGLLLFFMTRSKTREYLENAAKYKDSLVPGFHPALGLPLYAPPNAAAAAATRPPAAAPKSSIGDTPKGG